MRHLFAIALAPLAVLACSSTTGGSDRTGTSAESVTSCPPGYDYECHLLQNRQVCDCVYVPPVCDFLTQPPPTGSTAWVAAWAVLSPTGECPDIPTPTGTGTWKNLVIPEGWLGSGCFDGIPNDMFAVFGAPQCSDYFNETPCCTYVWWPQGFSQPDPCSLPTVEGGPQDTSGLCTTMGQTFVALEQTKCGNFSGKIETCPRPGSGTCGTCTKVLPPPP